MAYKSKTHLILAAGAGVAAVTFNGAFLSGCGSTNPCMEPGPDGGYVNVCYQDAGSDATNDASKDAANDAPSDATNDAPSDAESDATSDAPSDAPSDVMGE